MSSECSSPSIYLWKQANESYPEKTHLIQIVPFVDVIIKLGSTQQVSEEREWDTLESEEIKEPQNKNMFKDFNCMQK